MQSKSYTLAISLLLLLLARLSPAQAPSPAQPKAGYVRFWDMLPAGNGSFQLLNANKTGEPPLATAQSYRYSSYIELPIGKYRLAVAKVGSTTPLKAFDVDVKADSYFTVLVAPQRIDVFDDTEDPKMQTGTLTIRNFFPSISISAVVGQTPVQALPYGQSVPVTGLPLERATVTLHGSLPDGKPAESAMEVDFKASKHATLLVIPDSYGRFRPRLTPDGKNP